MKAINPCVRCGKERVMVREWIEKIPSLFGDEVKVINRENVCPDPDCQIIVQEGLNKDRKKREKITEDREKNLKIRKGAKHNV